MPIQLQTTRLKLFGIWMRKCHEYQDRIECMPLKPHIYVVIALFEVMLTSLEMRMNHFLKCVEKILRDIAPIAHTIHIPYMYL